MLWRLVGYTRWISCPDALTAASFPGKRQYTQSWRDENGASCGYQQAVPAPEEPPQPALPASGSMDEEWKPLAHPNRHAKWRQLEDATGERGFEELQGYGPEQPQQQQQQQQHEWLQLLWEQQQQLQQLRIYESLHQTTAGGGHARPSFKTESTTRRRARQRQPQQQQQQQLHSAEPPSTLGPFSPEMPFGALSTCHQLHSTATSIHNTWPPVSTFYVASPPDDPLQPPGLLPDANTYSLAQRAFTSTQPPPQAPPWPYSVTWQQAPFAAPPYLAHQSLLHTTSLTSALVSARLPHQLPGGGQESLPAADSGSSSPLRELSGVLEQPDVVAASAAAAAVVRQPSAARTGMPYEDLSPSGPLPFGPGSCPVGAHKRQASSLPTALLAPSPEEPPWVPWGLMRDHESDAPAPAFYDETCGDDVARWRPLRLGAASEDPSKAGLATRRRLLRREKLSHRNGGAAAQGPGAWAGGTQHPLTEGSPAAASLSEPHESKPYGDRTGN